MFFSCRNHPNKQTPNVSIHPESVNQVFLISEISKNSQSPGSIFSFMFTENLCLKKIRSFKPSNPTHPLWFYYHEMYDNFSVLNVTFWSLKVMPSGKALPRWDEIVLPEHICTEMSSTFFGLRNRGLVAWPIRACFFSTNWASFQVPNCCRGTY